MNERRDPMPDARPRRNPQTAHRTIDGEAVVVLPARMELRVLSETGSRVWDLCDGESTVAGIAERIASEFEVSPDAALRDVTQFLGELVAVGLVVIEEKPAQ